MNRSFTGSLLPLFYYGILLILLSTIPFAFIRPFRTTPLKEFQIPDKLYVIFRNDDISFSSDLKMECHLVDLFSQYNADQIFAIIPRMDNDHYYYENKPLTDSLITWEQKGQITPAIHGYTHEIHVHGEFKGLRVKTQDSLISLAIPAFRKIFNSPMIFVPPRNQLDKNTIEVCESHDIRIISGYRGEPIVDSVTYFNTNLSLLSGELPAIQDVIRENKIRLKKTILVILYHSAYEFKSNSELTELTRILHHLSSRCNGTFGNMDSLIAQYPDYLAYINVLGLNFKKAERQISYFKYMGLTFISSPLNQKLTDSYNQVFTGEPGLAFAEINNLILKNALLTFVLFFFIGNIIFILLLLASLVIIKKYSLIKKVIYIAGPVCLFIGIILQYSYFADQPKWRIILQLIIYIGIGFCIPLISKLFLKDRFVQGPV